jgi:integrase
MLSPMRAKQDELTVIPNKARLYKQNGSRRYYAAIRLDNGRWERKATGEEDLEAAKLKAFRLYDKAQFAAENNLPQTTRSFSGIAKAVIQQMEATKDTSQWVQTYKHYIGVLNKYAIPYFRTQRLSQVKTKADGYFPYVMERMGRELSKSTVATHTSALNLVFDYATNAGYMTVLSVPKFRFSGTSSQRRATFELSEYRRVINCLNAWRKKNTHRAKDAEIRHLLYDYVLILANTGIRHGREAMDLKWQNLSFRQSQNGHPLIVFKVMKRKGRKGTVEWRDVVMRDKHGNAIKILNRLKDRQKSINRKSVKTLVKERCDKPIFALSDGSQPSRMDGTFKKFLEDYNLLVGDTGQSRTLYSWRHFYATTELTRSTPISIALLAKQMGTSVKMIEQHYGHLDVVKEGDALSGRVRW